MRLSKILAAALLLFSSVHAFSQKSFYISPVVGYGVSRFHHATDNPLIPNFDSSTSAVGAVNAQISVGMNVRKLNFTAGLGYVTNGYHQKKFIVQFVPGTNSTLEYDYSYRFFTVPLSAGYKFNFRKLILTPSLGLEIAYFINEKQRQTLDGVSKTTINSSSYLYSKFNVIGNAKVDVGYQISPKVNLFAGPAVHYMLTNFLGGNSGPYYARLRGLAVLGEVGFQYSFGGSSHSSTGETPATN